MNRLSKALAAVMLVSTMYFVVGCNTKSHEYVDLGLPSGTLWATCNVGANAPEEYGDYFAWGETEPKTTYNWDTYKYSNGDTDQLTKYCTNYKKGYNGFKDNLTVLQPCDDAATANWGIDWCMPTEKQWDELRLNTTRSYTTQNGVYGCLFTASNGNSLFLPAAGRCEGDKIRDVGSFGDYWSSTLSPVDSHSAMDYDFGSGTVIDYRYYGHSTRAVRSAR